MNTKTGIVMKIQNSNAFIMTGDGEFVKIKIDKKDTSPMIGSEYSGIVLKNSFFKNNIFKYASAACLMIFILLGGGGAYAYYKPVSTVTININPSIELKTNRWNKVINASPLNEDGKKLLQEISLKNKSVDDALVLVLNQAQKDKFINENYIINNKTVTISVKGKEYNFSSFEKDIDKDDFNIKIDNNGTTVFSKNSKHGGKASSDKVNSSIDNSVKLSNGIINQGNTNNQVLPAGGNMGKKNAKKDTTSNSDSKDTNNSIYEENAQGNNTNINSEYDDKNKKNDVDSDYESNTDDYHNKKDDKKTIDSDSNHSNARYKNDK